MELNKYIEHTILSPTCTSAQIQKLCEEAKEYQFKGVCVPPFYIRYAKQILSDSPIRLISVVGFPLGYTAIASKVEEVKRAVDEGVDELDMVANICAIKDNKWAHVQNDIDGVTRAAHLHGKTIKVIVEAHLLTNDELRRVCELCCNLGVNYIKTSTGFNADPATAEQVRLIKSYISGETKIKAAGGIKTKEQATQLINAGASRLGTSAGLQLIGVSIAEKK